MPACDLIAPQSYRDATPAERAEVVNGCGPGGWRLDLVPDDLLGLDITEACNIHDWMYHAGDCEQDRHEADRTLLSNLLSLIRSVYEEPDSSLAAYLTRREGAWVYYKAVSDFGHHSFWADKPSQPRLATGTEARC